MQIETAAHPLLHAAAFMTAFAEPVGAVQSGSLAALLAPDAAVPLTRDERVRQAVRDMLRHGGHKPTGRGKPAAEYLSRAAAEGVLVPINAAVDACNAVSLHSGLPISVVDLDRAIAPFRIGIGEPGERYVFNASGQEISVAGLVCLYDAAGPCANPVRDAQRTKTHDGTRWTLSVVWGVAGHEDHVAAAVAWYRALLHGLNAETTPAHTT